MANITADLAVKGELRLGESPIWHVARQCLYWIDLYDPALFRLAPGMAAPERRALALVAPIGSAVATDDSGCLILSHRDGLSLLDLETLALTPYAHPEAGRDGVIYNDLKCDRWGRLWVATSHAVERDPRGALWCVKDRSTMALGDVGFPIGNGPAFSPDGRLLYLNDSFNRQTFVYDIAASDLHPRNRRVFATYTEEEGLPDGLTIDAEGCIWTAQWTAARVIRLSPAGEKLLTVHVPSFHVTSVCFAGADLRDLYITTARDGLTPEQLDRFPLSGSLFRLRSDVPGLAEPLFRL
ncbi:MAG: SMP-30/gluconolactonase/LRE family protein [Rhizobiales bacterium]|nr:SMP-30/gluconolactonase/LRE family protein [Hyphomicrobiales bacterium]MBI3674877.1 SMP-30/gluconolactonase/LRE family protein [Hyphomicrobiales bacterium]